MEKLCEQTVKQNGYKQLVATVKIVFDPAQTAVLVPQYVELLDEKKAVRPVFRELFRLYFIEKTKSLPVLREKLALGSVAEVVAHLKVLQNYLNSLNVVLAKTNERLVLRKFCLECLTQSIISYARGEGKILRVCSLCGLEPDGSLVNEEFEHRIPMGSTYAPENKLSSTKGLGGTFNHKKFLHVLLTSYGMDYNDFCKKQPKIALALLSNYMVGTETAVYRLMENGSNIVRFRPIEEFYEHVERFWHSFDKPLRKRSTHLASCEKSNKLKSTLDFAEGLVDFYRIDRKDTNNQIFINSLGCSIRKIVSQLIANKRHYSAAVIAGTLFYQTLCLFRKVDLVLAAKKDLKVSNGLINFFNDYMEFEKKQKEENGSGDLLAAMEIVCGAKTLT